MIKDDISITDIIISFENTLRIDYDLPTVKEIVNSSIMKLEAAYSTKIDKPLFDILINTRFTNAGINDLIVQIENNLKSLALLTSITMFNKIFTQTLKDVNYLGYTRREIQTSLKYFQDNEYYDKKDSFYDMLVESLNSVPLGIVKKLFIILLVLDKLDVKEGASCVAQYLYLGGVMRG